ncbi:MAG: LysM peptidoglycan-binding domain-containing protein [Verrucomicrobiae bacterium]|nr:LysM peptidoglycan-binding domain-containing protein [Verrucomicrobiae bacterium]
MRWRVILSLSLAANLALAAGWFVSHRRAALRPAELPRPEVSEAAQVKTNVVVRRQFFSWQEVESEDYPTYIANLRAIACPEQTVRDIIIADVNAIYARRRATEVFTPEQQWWRSEPDTNVLQIALAKIRELDEERRGLLTRLLGDHWEGGDLVNLPRPTRPGLALDGPILGVLPADVKQAVQEIYMHSQERMEAYLQSHESNPTEVARLRRQFRDELAQVLSPHHLEEFLLRYSHTADALRKQLGELKYFDATADEFRAAFHAIDPIDLKLESLAGATDTSSVQLREALVAQRKQALEAALGAERYQQFRQLQDATYRDAYAAALEAGAPETAGTLYQINQATAQELAAIRANTNLGSQQLAYELKKAELEQIRALAQALGQELPTEPVPEPKPPPPKLHVLAPGEGLDFIARLYAVDPNALRAANPNFDRLKPGQPVNVPLNLLPLIPGPPMPPQ